MLFRKLSLFLLIGGLSAGAFALASTILVQWLPAYKAEISIGVYLALFPITFFGQRHITFRSSGNGLAEFFKYACLQIVSILFSTWLLIPLVSGHPTYDLVAFLLIAGLAAIISFAVCNTAIFRAGPRQES